LDKIKRGKEELNNLKSPSFKQNTEKIEKKFYLPLDSTYFKKVKQCKL
jgi:hypothetical protein